jgi:hypothetical protein
MAKLEPWLGLRSGADGVKDGPSVFCAQSRSWSALGRRIGYSRQLERPFTWRSKPMPHISGLAQKADVKTVISFFGSRISSKQAR